MPGDGKTDFLRYINLSNESSMLNWWPKVEELDIPKPRTILKRIPPGMVVFRGDGVGKEFAEWAVEVVREGIRQFGLPLFLRTDHLSGKHHFVETCFIQSEDRGEIEKRIVNLVLTSEMAGIGLPVRVIAVREYILPDWRFKAFAGLPIAPEVRVFIANGKVEKWIFYWPEDAIEFWPSTKEWKRTDWREKLREMREISEAESEIFLGHAEKVARVFDNNWSVDFMRTIKGEWLLIDMARAEVSWGYEV